MIQIKNVSFHYDSKQIFNNINLNIEEGSFIWLQGLNGSGKTTLLRMILDFIRPQAGDIQRRKHLKMGWAPAVDNSFFPRLTGQENLNFFANLADVKCTLPPHLDPSLTYSILSTPFYQMSAGMKQLLILFRAMLTNPDLLLLDEPVRGLDNVNKDHFLEIIRALNKDKKTILITSHQLIDDSFNNFKQYKIHDHQIH